MIKERSVEPNIAIYDSVVQALTISGKGQVGIKVLNSLRALILKTYWG